MKPALARRGGQAHVMQRSVAVVLVLLALVLGVFFWRSPRLLFPADNRQAALPADRASILPKGAPSRFLQPHSVGLPVALKTRPLVAQVSIVDLDRDGLADIVACDVLENRVVWLRQAPRGTFTESAVGTEVRAPAHAEAVDIDGDGDLDLLVASLGVMFPSNARIGSVVVLESDGHGRFTNRVIASEIARVADVRRRLDGDGDRPRRRQPATTMARRTGWRIWKLALRSTRLLNLSGAINVEIADLLDGDLDIASHVSRSGKRYTFVNDGRGHFEPRLVWGSTNDDFGSN
jgi:hypothetical protein